VVVITMINDDPSVANPPFPPVGSRIEAAFLGYSGPDRQPRLSLRPSDVENARARVARTNGRDTGAFEMAATAQLLNEKLKLWNFFGECILWEFHSTHFGFGLDLAINFIWDKDGRIREDALEKPLLYIFHLLGIDSLHLVGDLTSGMKVDPMMINWGFAEVSRVEAFESSVGCGLTFKWEGVRRLDLEFNEYILLSPEGHAL
jgi:hypothetical protein